LNNIQNDTARVGVMWKGPTHETQGKHTKELFFSALRVISIPGDGRSQISGFIQSPDCSNALMQLNKASSVSFVQIFDTEKHIIS